MNNFEFYVPTKVIFGKDEESKVGEQVVAFGGSRVLLHYGSNSSKESGLIDKVKKYLDEAGLFYVEFGGVVANPRLSKVYTGIELCKEHNIDFILAVGGGSVIDSGKAIAMGVASGGDVWDFFSRKRVPEHALPVGVVLTIAAAGSETSMSCVIKNEEENIKRGVISDLNRPKFAIMNPELTYTVPEYQIACGIVDIIMHTLDRYFSPTKETDFIDRISEGLLHSVMHTGKRTLKDPINYSARANLMWAGSISHNTITGTGKVFDFSNHAIEHEVSGKYDIAHGAGLSCLWGNWARYVYKQDIMRFAQYAVNVLNVDMDFERPEATALEGIERTEAYFKSIGMPTNFKEAGIEVTDEDIIDMAKKCTFFGGRKIGSFRVLGYDDITIILKNARG